MAESCSSSPLFVAEHDPSASQVSHASLSMPSSLLLSSSVGAYTVLPCLCMCRDITKTFPNFVFYTIVTDNPSSGWSWGMWFWIFVGASWFFSFFLAKEMVQYCILKTCFLLNFDSNSICIWNLAFLIYFKAIFKLTNLGTKIK